jgi:hypothetical protein
MEQVGAVSQLAVWAGERLNRELGQSQTNYHVGASS